MALPTVGLLSGLEIWDVLSGVPVVLEQKTTILWNGSSPPTPSVEAS
jgi:hypothetical protein